MGVNDREQDKRDDKRRKADETRKRRARGQGTGNSADWAGANGELVCKAISVIARTGGAIRMGYSRDGGAYAIGIYGDGETFTEYVAPSEDLDEYLRGLIDDYGN